ncbi:MAG: FKBP-type peptidyl-prolyl cis-trans isomerase [Saprospiraceae bacterium]
MKNWIALSFLGVLFFAGCNGDDGITYPAPEWEENVAFVAADGTPDAQIDLFVAANNMDTVVTESGLVYVILEPGSSERPSANSRIVAWYKGYTVDGTIFDQSGSTPFTSSLTNLIQGWQEGIPLLGKGGKMWMLLKPELAYGDRPPSSDITTTSVLVFEIELADF